MSDSTFGFIGLGLIGGSIAKGLRRANKDITIMAYMRTRSKLEQQRKRGRSISSLTGSMRRSPHVTSSFSVPRWSTMPCIWKRSVRS